MTRTSTSIIKPATLTPAPMPAFAAVLRLVDPLEVELATDKVGPGNALIVVIEDKALDESADLVEGPTTPIEKLVDWIGGGLKVVDFAGLLVIVNAFPACDLSFCPYLVSLRKQSDGYELIFREAACMMPT